jgi:CheY-like chemotaxis protein
MKDERPAPCMESTILIVDDDKTVLHTFMRILSVDLPDWRVQGAANGAEAVEAFRQAHHAIILMDIYLPVMDGLEAFAQLERECETRNWEMPRVVFCSGFFPPKAVNEVLENNPAHCLLHKPVDRERLIATIKESAGLA